jgi:hypothetical protein
VLDCFYLGNHLVILGAYRDIMKNLNVIVLLVSFFPSLFVCAAPRISADFGDIICDFSGTYKPETFYAKNVKLLNNNNVNDRLWWARHTLDLKTHLLYGKETYCVPVAEFQFTLRSRGMWGNPEGVIKSTSSETKLLDAVGQPHTHAIPHYLFWMREAWLDINMSQALGLNINNSHRFKLGVFPFQLGRGISLGDAYAVAPEYLGFYTETVVDQYACGALLEGDIILKKLHYDMYAAILQNKCGNFNDVAQKIRGQEYGRLDNPQRGFGKVNFIIASRLKWHAFDNALGKLTFEPYALLNHVPEQKIEFVADASAKLGTFGLAGEYFGERWEFGFDTALNIGKQRVSGWDRNQVIGINREGYAALVNSHVVDQNNNNIPFVGGSAAQRIIRNENKAQQDESLNGKTIGQVDAVGFLPTTKLPGPVSLINKAERYRNPYSNKFEGYMFVTDAACWLYKKELQMGVTAGISSGDDNPNLDTKDQQYGGFIPLQEIYSGKRVQSAYLLGSGKIGRPLSVPQGAQPASSKFAKTVSNFSNLVFWGTGLKWEPSNWKRKLSVRPNALMYWEDFKINKFDVKTKKELNEKASTYLGSEINVFIDYFFFRDIKIFCVSSVFIPGTHFTDIKGRPLDRDQELELDAFDVTGVTGERIPNISDNVAYTFNMGLEFKF